MAGTLPFRNSKEAKEVAGNLLEGFRPGEYPHLAEMKPGYRYGDEFEYGLDLILDGIARARSNDT